MNINIEELRNYSQSLRSAADQLDGTIHTLESLGDMPNVSSGGKKPASKRSPSPAGARKSIHHPNENDVKVLDAMLELGPNDIKAADVVEKTNIDKVEVQKSIKWLNSSNNIETHGRGRGTSYSTLVTSNALQVVDPTTLGGNYRNPDGPKVIEIVRAVFNILEPMQKVSPGEVVEMAQEAFADQHLERSSFGTVFSQMGDANELFFEGKGRGRHYWRGPDKLENAAKFPGNPPSVNVKEANETEATG